MLASTVQFSRYGRYPAPTPAQPCDVLAAGPAGQKAEHIVARSLRTQQRAQPGRRGRHPSPTRGKVGDASRRAAGTRTE